MRENTGDIFLMLLKMAVKKAQKEKCNLFFACYPGWDYEGAVEEPLNEEVRFNLLKYGMVYAYRTPEMK